MASRSIHTWRSRFKAVGPILGAVTFAWSLTNGLGAPFDVHLTFVLCSVLALTTVATAWLGIPPALNEAPSEPSRKAMGEPAAEAEPAAARSDGASVELVRPSTITAASRSTSTH